MRSGSIKVASLIIFATTRMALAAINPNVTAAQRLMVRQKYHEAAAQIRAVLKSDNNNIDALYTAVAIEQTRLLDYESYVVDGLRFQTMADSLLKIIETKQLRLRGDDSLRCLFYRANIIGGTSLIQIKRGAWIDGARSAVASQNIYKQIKKIDPNHLGSDLGLGIFDYYFGTSMKMIPFVSGSGIERGVEAIERSLNAPFPFYNAAKSTYCWILIDRKQYKKADSLARSALMENPDVTIFLRIRALIALWTGCYDDAIVIAGKICAASALRNPINWSDLTMSYYIIAIAHDNMGRKREAYETACVALNIQVPEAYKNMPHVKEHIKALTNIRSKYGKK